MAHTRPKWLYFQLADSNAPKDDKVPSLAYLSLQAFAAQHVNYFLPNAVERSVLVPIRDGNSDITMCVKAPVDKLLHAIVYRDTATIKLLLDDDPELLLEKGFTFTPAGLKVKANYPLWCVFGAGDPDLVRLLRSYFLKIENGVEHYNSQVAVLRPLIQAVLTAKSYDFTWLLDVIKNASDEDVNAELNKIAGYDSVLRDCMHKFRSEFTVQEVHLHMHFIYAQLTHAMKVYEDEYDNLQNAHGNMLRNELFLNQIIGFIQRGLPALERIILDKNYKSIPIKAASLKPFDMAPLKKNAGLGFDYWEGSPVSHGWTPTCRAKWEHHIKEKFASLLRLSMDLVAPNDLAASVQINLL